MWIRNLVSEPLVLEVFGNRKLLINVHEIDQSFIARSIAAKAARCKTGDPIVLIPFQAHLWLAGRQRQYTPERIGRETRVVSQLIRVQRHCPNSCAK
jgi:hypothetical protein